MKRTNNDLVEFNQDDNNLKEVASFDPKRNSAKSLIEQAQQIVRQDANSRQNTINQFLNKQIQDDSFQTIKSISEYLMLAFEEYRDGKNLQPTEAANKVKDEYNKILQKIFKNYEIVFSWEISTRKASFSIKKRGLELQPNLLSSGENALISLVFALFYGKDSIQVYLIDEPEIHLNWQLEESLFDFLDWFVNEYKKQLIVITHSRVCFIEKFLCKTKFLVWNDENKIDVIEHPTQEIISLLSGDFVKIIGGITSKNKLVYVEDNTHKHILNKLSVLLDLELEIQILQNSSEVEKFSKAFKKLNIQNVHFLVDNDNKQIKNISETLNLIHLDKYCIENYFLDEQILSEIDRRNKDQKTQKDVKALTKEAVNQVQQTNFTLVKKMISQNLELTQDILDRIDASQFIKTLAISLGFTQERELIDSYLEKLKEKEVLVDHFSILNSIIK